MDIVRGFEPRVPGSNPGEGTLKMILFSNMKKILIFSLLIISLPIIVFAAAPKDTILGYTCKESPCGFQDLINLIPTVINFVLTYILTPAAILFLTIGGLVLLTSAANPERRSLGINILKATIIGMFLALGAWVIINFILTVLGAKQLGS